MRNGWRVKHHKPGEFRCGQVVETPYGRGEIAAIDTGRRSAAKVKLAAGIIRLRLATLRRYNATPSVP